MESIQHQSEPTPPSVEVLLPVPPVAAGQNSTMESERAISTADILPAVLERSAFEYHFNEYLREFQPVGHLEHMVVRDMARQTAAIDTWNEGVGALQRQRAQRLPELVLPQGDDDDGELEDISLAAAISAPEVHLSEQHEQRRSRAFYRALRTLLDLQSRRKTREAGGALMVPQNHFLTEAACEDYLRKRFEQGCHQCPRCGGRRGNYINARRCWECADCKRQTGLRSGTVAADSPLPLMVWFTAIQLLLSNPAMGTTELGMKLGITRSTTVRNLAKRVVMAMADENVGELLAGLDICYARCPAMPPEASAPDNQNMGSGAADIEGPSTSDASHVDMRG